ncbi:uncharacterized protein MEPE_05815 [Melanopsichium pennsylvanicum]|uniref:Defects in morphology protein 1 n=1 Tax=Melanopsichium pennsylvanicum TaxID=63383 RepID=A0AAJ5C7P1_9BASI|nr:uncharacterized protein MEPE_05815 [Melanopsichium pennsylvanicum]
MNSANPERRRTRRSPPASLPDHFNRKGYLSVSDLVGPSWCEYNYQYGILSLSHLPPSQRPSTITTVSGTILSAAPALVEKKDAILFAGKTVHTILEKQVAPVQVNVKTETKEDSWALRILNLWCDVQALLQLKPAQSSNKGKGKAKEHNCVREVPVYGWMYGVFVMGVIDEIEKRCTHSQPKQKKSTMTWTSQEEWKKHKLRNKASPKKPKAKVGESKNSCVCPLTCFFGSQSESQSDAQVSSPSTKPSEANHSWAYFLSDTKTRISSWLPAQEDQVSARMQCMTYKRLFDGLLLGALSSSPPLSAPSSSSSSSSQQSTVSFDSNATPMDWTHTFTSLDLDPHQPLSTSFLRDAEPLCESWGVDLALFVANNDADVCTLHHIRLLLEQGLRELARDAKKGQGLEDEQGDISHAAVIQDLLTLTYRRQSWRRRRKRKKTPVERSPKKEMDKEADGLRQVTLFDTAIAKSEPESEVKAHGDDEGGDDPPNLDISDETRTSESVNQEEGVESVESVESVETRKSIDALEGRNDASQAIEQALSSLSPCSPRKASSSTQPCISLSSASSDSPSSSEHDPESNAASIIGIVSFSHDSNTLDTYLGHMIAMWKGQRELMGVSVHQTRRCWTCEWMDGCEWRAAQVHRHFAQTKTRSQTHAKGSSEVKVEFDLEGLDEQREMHYEAVGKAVDEDGEGEEDGEFWNTLDYDAIQVRDSSGNLLEW